VPDITPSPGTPEAMARASIEAAISMPLLEVFARMVIEIVVVVVAAKLVMSFVERLGVRAARVIDGEKQKERGFVVTRIVADTGIQAAQRPIKLLVPAVAAIYSLRTVGLALQILVENEMFRNTNKVAKHSMLMLFKRLQKVDTYAFEFWQLGVIILTGWLLLDWKDRLVKIVVDVEKKDKEGGGEGYGLHRIVLPLSSLVSWAMIVVGMLTSLHVVGVNIQPLLAFGGVSGIAIGLGAQQVTANLVAGVNLFITRPFIVGDRIELKTTGGGTVLVGIVEKIDPMRTVLRTDGTVPQAIPNKAITEYIVSNESRIGRSEVVAQFKDPRQYSTSFKVKNQDFSQVPDILTEVMNYLKMSPGVDKLLPMSAKLQALGDSSVTVAITAHTTATQSREFQNFNHDVLMAIGGILQKRGISFA